MCGGLIVGCFCIWRSIIKGLGDLVPYKRETGKFRLVEISVAGPLLSKWAMLAPLKTWGLRYLIVGLKLDGDSELFKLKFLDFVFGIMPSNVGLIALLP